MLAKTFLSIFFNVVLFHNVISEIQFNFNNVKTLTAASLEELKQSPHVTVVYYYKRELPRLKSFLKELDKSAEYLNLYDSQTGLFDCTVNKAEACSEKNIEHNLLTYKDGIVMLKLELLTVFDVNSILSNVLQLILLHEVPIIQTYSNRQKLEEKQKGKKDIIYSYHRAIGTYEHRVFMELAFAYQSKYLFAVTTELESLAGLKDSATISTRVSEAVWVLYCKDPEHVGQGCKNSMYRGKMDLVSIANFFKSYSMPSVFLYPEQGSIPECRKDDMPCLMLFYDDQHMNDVMGHAKRLKYDVFFIAGVVAVNIDHPNSELGEVAFEGKSVPAIGILEEEGMTYMKEEWGSDNIDAFVRENLLNKYKGFVEEEEESRSISIQEKLNLPTIEEVETQDDFVAEAVYQVSKETLKLDGIRALTDKTFPTSIADYPLIIVLFYLPFDSQSMAFQQAYLEVIKILNESTSKEAPLGMVNCYDWTDICQKQNITDYPTTRIFRKTAKPVDYLGPLDTKAVISAVKLLQLKTPIMLKSKDEVESFSRGQLPNEAMESYSNVSVLGIFDKTSQKELNTFKKVAQTLETSFLFAVASPADAKCSMCPNKAPAIVVFRHNDPILPIQTLTQDLTEQGIEIFVKKSEIISLPELTVGIFPLLYNQQKPFVVLFCNTDNVDETANAMVPLAEIVESKHFPGIIFTWINSESENGKALLEYYSPTAALPTLSFVNIQKGEVFNMPESGLTKESILQWLQEVTEKKIEPSKMLKTSEWKPLKRGYDYLKFQEIELKYGVDAFSPIDPIKVTTEEFGLGFNNDGSEVSYDKQDSEDDSVDEEIRAELLELHKSRLYNLQKERSKLKEKKEEKSAHAHTHTEL